MNKNYEKIKEYSKALARMHKWTHTVSIIFENCPSDSKKDYMFKKMTSTGRFNAVYALSQQHDHSYYSIHYIVKYKRGKWNENEFKALLNVYNDTVVIKPIIKTYNLTKGLIKSFYSYGGYHDYWNNIK